MLFNSLPFIGLFSITFLIYWSIPQKGRKPLLLLSSLIFYFYSGFAFSIHFLLVIAVNFFFSLKLWEKKREGQATSKLLFWIILLNFLNLAFFKYFYFFLDTLDFFSGSSAFSQFGTTIHIPLPLAISFYTFQLIALQVDIHRDHVPEKIPALDYFLFILFFPQLIAGPIMRTTDFLPKLDKPAIDFDRVKWGIFLILSGLFKKVVMADNISGIISPVYSNPESYNSLALYVTTFGFACQVYCDFSGYTDIARGSAYLLGYEIPENFRGPFLSPTFREFWGRWHVTLSTWLKDYLYIPLGGSRGGFWRTQLNSLITMTLGGLWHGANFGYVIWGAYLGLILGLERLFSPDPKKEVDPKGWKRFWKITLIVHLFAVSGIFFRTASVGKSSLSLAGEYFKGFLNILGGKALVRWEELVLFILLAFFWNAVQYYPNLKERISRRFVWLLPTFSIIMLLLLGIFGDGGGEFIYFQF
ncbi:MBOAT family protein [Leptospira langatensis]|uniref:MBOAT family protein n=1 Tax=Leptospira langatensis TaxID=2484983 RepID=A0A5F1ZY07_9LEPT|nr:MBOAT family O-acyltransferase [Leptospira langatensis]TGK04084.1 MBOAT family protein [Leptospira langatensis]TGL43564.1 MBOAT family protein [Leptospira langatensis]